MMTTDCSGMLLMGDVHLLGSALLVGLLLFLAHAFWQSLQRDFPVLR